MAKENETGEKTEDPTQKKLMDAQKRGEVAKSQEVITWFMLLGTTFILAMMGPGVAQDLMSPLGVFLARAGAMDIFSSGAQALFTDVTLAFFTILLIPMGLLAICAILGNMVQHPPLFSVDPIKPKWSKISPLVGIKRLFSKDALINFAKGLMKLVVISVVMFLVLWPDRDYLDVIMTLEPVAILGVFQAEGLKLLGAVLIVAVVIAIADFLYQKQKFFEQQKMTVKETRDEHKDMEGDPTIKGKLRQIRMERSRKRMMADVPDASVIITNPTHFAVALKYDISMSAPLCVAKGTDDIALKIQALGKEHRVPVVENPPLARALFASLDIGQVIAQEHFKAVAGVIGYVMSLKNNPGWRPTRH